VHFLPMLEFAFKNENKLEEIILHNYSRYGGIILTSPRAAEALDRCIQHIKKRINTEADTQLTDNLKIAAEYWQSHPLFAVVRY
jgi:uroporphyrinogen-III synthase